jgi:predicted DNA-binding transcriptional regulator AlpA
MSFEINDLKKLGFLRINQIIGKDGLIPISRSSWWAGVKSGKFPKPVGGSPFGPKTTVWRVIDILNYIETVSKCDGKL